MKKLFILFILIFINKYSWAQDNRITIDLSESYGEVSPFVYGQFIEYMGHCIDGGIYEENSPLSDDRGFRVDVLKKAKELSPTMLRFPGGTVVKTFHWEDGVGPKELRKTKKNLIWGGINTYHFGTCEFIEYCKELNCEPVLVVNISTGTPDEAANWVEYCNGTGDTYYANLRRAHGYPEPFNVKYWALGNEEAAEPDAGKHQNPNDYVKDVWHFIKLMKLTDPSIKLIANGESGNLEWTKTALKGLDGAIDYISYHAYARTDQGKPYSIFKKIEDTDKGLANYAKLIKETVPETVQNWKKWYRFPCRTNPVKIALDEWGIWENQEPPYGTTNTYEWRHGLAVACFLNAILHNAAHIGMANWAQMVNILAPIMTNKDCSIKQTVFYPLKEYRFWTQKESVKVNTLSPKIEEGIQSLNVAATVDRSNGTLTLFVVNISPDKIKAVIDFKSCTANKLLKKMTLTATSFDAKNTLKSPEKNVVSIASEHIDKKVKEMEFLKESITICQFSLDNISEESL